MSIQGVQPKLSARLNAARGVFEIVDSGGYYILKPQTPNYTQVPENEDLTLRLAELVGIEVPLHGLIYSKDGSLTFFIRRFDRKGRKEKVAVEDFAQLSGMDRDTKYRSSMEKVASIVETYCTFPAIDRIKLFKLTLFNYLVGNEDCHLKNFSLIRHQAKVELSPAYDLVNTTIILNAHEEIALPLNGKKRNLRKKDLLDYWGRQRLGLTEKSIGNVMQTFQSSVDKWLDLIDISFLSLERQERYKSLIIKRRLVLN